jgi:SAM-dependent methyltransferase
MQMKLDLTDKWLAIVSRPDVNWRRGGKMTVTEATYAGPVTRSLSHAQDIVAFMQSTARQQPGGRLALDVGARDGSSSQPYAQAGWLVVSADIAMEGLRLGVKEGRIQPGRAVVADGRHLPFRDGAFDLVSSRWFLHEFPDPVAFLREMKRVVKDSGVVVAVDLAAPSRSSQGFLNRYIMPEEHVRTCGEFAGPWAEAGLAIEATEWHLWRIKRDGETRKAVCGRHSHVVQKVRDELHITCYDKHLFLRAPMAFVVAHRSESLAGATP